MDKDNRSTLSKQEEVMFGGIPISEAVRIVNQPFIPSMVELFRNVALLIGYRLQTVLENLTAADQPTLEK